MPSWNELGLKIFNDSTITQSSTKRGYSRKRLVARSSEARRQLTARRYFSVTLGGLQVTEEQLQEIRDFEAATSNMEPFLVRLSTFHLFEDANKNGSQVGTGTGIEQEFQLVKRTGGYQGDPPRVDIIQYPNHDYYPLRDLNHEDWTALPPLKIWLGNPKTGGVDITSACEIDRNTGKFTTTQTGAIYATGGFYWLMICPTDIGVTPLQGGYYEIDSGIQFIEPFPEGGEVEDD